MAQRESIMDLINRLGVEKSDPRLRMDPYNYPSGAPDVVAQFGSGLQGMGQRLESSLQAEDDLGRFAELIPRWFAANPAQNIGALLQIREPEVEQLRGMAEEAIADPVGTAQSLGQAGIEAVQDPLGTAEQMSALEMLGGGKALSSIAKRLGRKDVEVTDALVRDVQPTRKGQLSQQLYEQAVARGEVPGELSKTTTYAKRIDQLRRIDEIQDLRMEIDRIDAEIPWNQRTPEESAHVAKLTEEVMQRKDAIDISDVDDYSSILGERPLLESLSNLPPQELARIDRAVNQGFNIDAFHGTAGDITDFDPGLLGKTTDAPSARKAYFFSRDADTANSYAQYADAAELGRVTKEELSAQLQPLLDKLQQVDQQLASQRQKIMDSFGGYGPSHIPAFDYDAHAKHDAIMHRAIDNDPKVKALEKEIDNTKLQIDSQYQNIMPVKLRMTNPLVHDFKGEAYREVSYHDLIQTAKDKGHDGVIMKNTTDGGPVTDIYAVFEPQQIRSRYATFEPERAPREVGDKPYTGKALEEKTLELQRDVEFASIEVDQLKSAALDFIEKNEGPISAIFREVLDEQGNVKTGPIKFSGPVTYAGAGTQVQRSRKRITDAIEFKEKAEKELADLIKGKLRTPRKTAGASYVLAEAAFPLGGITASIAYDVNQRGDK